MAFVVARCSSSRIRGLLSMLERYADKPFIAKLTGRDTDSVGTFVYSWVEQRADPATGIYAEARPARFGTTTANAAYELNSIAVDVTDEPLVRMWYKGARGGRQASEFEASSAAVAVPCGVSTSVTGTCTAVGSGSPGGGGTPGSVGPFDGSETEDSAVPGGTAWNNPDNVLVADGSSATVTIPNGGTSDLLWDEAFTIVGIPPGSTITGFKIEAKTTIDLAKSTLYGGVGAAFVPVGGATAMSGTSGSYFSLTLGNPGITDLSTLGVFVYSDCPADFSSDVAVDHIRLTVFYTTSSAGGGSTTTTDLIEFTMTNQCDGTVYRWCKPKDRKSVV